MIDENCLWCKYEIGVMEIYMTYIGHYVEIRNPAVRRV